MPWVSSLCNSSLRAELVISVLPREGFWASLVAQLVKNPPTMRETWVRSLGKEDPLETGKPSPSRILAWKIPWTV